MPRESANPSRCSTKAAGVAIAAVGTSVRHVARRTVETPDTIERRHLGNSSRKDQCRRVPCAKSVPESDIFMPLELALREKQIPQILKTQRSESS
jgi:hypothetical protein